MPTIPTTEPASFRAGDTVKWDRTDLTTDYPAGTWTLKYYLVKSNTQHTITASNNADLTFSISLAKTTTAAYAAGTYAWVAKVSSGGEEYTIDSGSMIVLPDLVAATYGFDARSDARKIYDDLITAYKSYISSNGSLASFSIGSKSVTFKSSADIIQQIEHWERIVRAEEEAEQIANGRKSPRRVGIRFNRI